MTRAPKKAVKERKVWSFARLEARRDTETTRVVIYIQESLSRGAAASTVLKRHLFIRLRPGRDSTMAIPVTVFTGFLGAGKTSIILSLLPQLPKDYRVVLLKNEFGEIEGAHSHRVLEHSADLILPKSIVN